jgi:uncharacterized protein YlxW (UPF0749 family)
MTTTGNTNGTIKKAFKVMVTFSAVFGFAASIWLVSAYFTKKDSSAVIVANKVETVIQNQQQEKIIRDSILLKLGGLGVLQDNMNKLQRSQENLTNAVTNFIRNNKLATKQDLDNFIEELKKNK